MNDKAQQFVLQKRVTFLLIYSHNSNPFLKRYITKDVLKMIVSFISLERQIVKQETTKITLQEHDLSN